MLASGRFFHIPKRLGGHIAAICADNRRQLLLSTIRGYFDEGMAHQQDDQIALVWQMNLKKKSFYHISLLPRSSVKGTEKKFCESSLPESTDTSSQQHPQNIPPDSGNSRNVIPESVLQYERQLRKAQHAKKAGATLHLNDLKVIYDDEHIVVVNKPAGVLTVPGINSNCSILDLVHAVYGKDCPDPATMIVHRLDMDTSGIVIFGRKPETTKRLHDIFRDRRVVKEYEALVIGMFPESIESGSIDLPLQRDHAHPPFMRVATPQSEAAAYAAVDDLRSHGWKKIVRKAPKPSQTEFTVLERRQNIIISRLTADHDPPDNDSTKTANVLPYTRLRLWPRTGRTHQLRVHCAALGFPIVGDPTYGLYGEAHPRGGLDQVTAMIVQNETICNNEQVGEKLSHLENQSIEIHNPPSLETLQAWTRCYPPNGGPNFPMCLHAARLAFEHPATRERMDFRAEPSFLKTE